MAGAAAGVGVQLLFGAGGTLLPRCDAYAGCHGVICRSAKGAGLQEQSQLTGCRLCNVGVWGFLK